MFKPDATRFLAFVFVVALLLGRGTLALLLGLVLLALLVARGWSAVVLRRLSYSRAWLPARAFVGDQVTLQIQLRNTKLLGVPGLRIQDAIPTRLNLQGVRLLPSAQPGTQLMERRTSLRAYEALNWRVAATCSARGYYLAGPVKLEATDPWGLHTTEMTLPGRAGLLVYPRLLPLDELQLNPRHPLGEIRAPQQLLSDPARTIGIRDYQPGDPFKAIHWGATARRGQFQTRVYEPTTSLELMIALDLDTFEQYWEGIEPELAERMISVAATVATAATEGRWSCGLFANGVAADSESVIRLSPSRSPAQLPIILENLAKIVPYSIAPMPQLLRRLGPTLPWGATLVLVSAVSSQAMLQALLRLAEGGRRILWLYCGSGSLPRVPGVDIRQVAPDTSWRAEHHMRIQPNTTFTTRERAVPT